MAHQIEDVEIEEEEYDENADEDFNPDAAREEGDVSSSSDGEDEEAPVRPTKGKGKGKKRTAEAVDGLDSGDEATIQERKKKRRKKEAAEQEDEESGGEGGLIKTRAQRLAEKIEKKHRKYAREGQVTIDVDQLWSELSTLPIGRNSYVMPKSVAEGMEVEADENKENAPISARPTQDDDEMVTIKRRIEYAGEVTEVEDRVPRSSKEAQLYLAEHPEFDPHHNADSPDAASTALLRPLKRPSIFEPNPTATVKGVAPDRLRPRAPSRLDVIMAEKRAEEERQRRAEKMTTVQKSALDWRGFVEGQKGLREELDEYGKSKRGFLAREEFLGRAELSREIRGREARLKG